MCGHVGRLRTKSSMDWRGERETAKKAKGPARAAGLGRWRQHLQPLNRQGRSAAGVCTASFVSSPKPSVCSLILFNK